MAILPNKNLKPHEVRDAINEAGGKADNTYGSLFRKENINFYSMEKPMSVKNVSGVANVLSELSEEDKRRCNYGYSMPADSDIITLTSYVRDGIAPNTWQNSDMGFGWFYNPPSGGADDPYRIADFKGYNSMQKTAFTFSGETTVNQMENRYTLAGKFPFGKFAYFEDMYFGVLFCKVGAGHTRGWFYVSNINLSESDSAEIILDEEYSTALFKTIGQSGGTWRIAPFLCSEMDRGKQSIIDNGSYANDVSMLRTVPVSIITATFESASVDQQAPYSSIRFVYIVKNVTRSQIVIELIAENTSSAQTLNLQNMNYEVTMESQNVDDGQYVEIHSGIPLASYFDTLIVAAGTSGRPSRTVLNDNMTILWTPRDGTEEMKTPFYIDISFSSLTGSGNDIARHNFGACRILYDEYGYWEQVE